MRYRQQRLLGAARTGAYYAVAPFIGVLLSVLILKEIPRFTFYIASVIMAAGFFTAASDKPLLRRKTDASPIEHKYKTDDDTGA